MLLFQQISILPHGCFWGIYPPLPHHFHYHPTTRVSAKSSFASHSPLRILVLKAPSSLNFQQPSMGWIWIFSGTTHSSLYTFTAKRQWQQFRAFSCSLGAHNETIFITWFKIFILHIGRVHRRVHQEEKPHKCDVEGCDKAFKTPAELSRHAFRHTGEKPHKCDQCDKAFIRYDDLKRHYRIHTGKYSMYYNRTVCTFWYLRPWMMREVFHDAVRIKRESNSLILVWLFFLWFYFVHNDSQTKHSFVFLHWSSKWVISTLLFLKSKPHLEYPRLRSISLFLQVRGMHA